VIGLSSLTVQQAVTIAIRYSAVRVHNRNVRNSHFFLNKKEQILDYQTQMHRLMPILAESYAMIFSHKQLIRRNA
jgi:acyl-CoA oxidase